MSAVGTDWQLARSERDRRAAKVIELEHWIGRRLGVDLFAGVTDNCERKRRIARLLIDRDLLGEVAHRHESGRTETWRALYLRVYGDDLTVGTADADTATIGEGDHGQTSAEG